MDPRTSIIEEVKRQMHRVNLLRSSAQECYHEACRGEAKVHRSMANDLEKNINAIMIQEQIDIRLVGRHI